MIIKKEKKKPSSWADGPHFIDRISSPVCHLNTIHPYYPARSNCLVVIGMSLTSITAVKLENSRFNPIRPSFDRAIKILQNCFTSCCETAVLDRRDESYGHVVL
jgi:hypothetical protein